MNSHEQTPILGIDIGSVRVHVHAVLGTSGRDFIRPIRGRASDTLAALLDEEVFPFLGKKEARTAVTGQGASLVSHPDFLQVNEIVAAARGARAFCPSARSAIDLGGQLSKWMSFGADGEVSDFATNGLCAAGAGAFLEQQAGRLGLTIDEFSVLAASAERGATVAGRCSVFAKSDMIHLQQRGTPVPEIALGVCSALARMFVATVLQGRELVAPIVLLGGGAENPGLVRALAEVTGLGKDAFLIPETPSTTTARGAAELAARAKTASLASLSGTRAKSPSTPTPAVSGASLTLSRLVDVPKPESSEHQPPSSGPIESYLGVDVGSVSTNLVLWTPDDKLIAGLYLRTRGDPLGAIRDGLGELVARFGNRLEILGVGTTGSGRHLAAKLLGADAVHNEITAQMISTHHFMPDADTIFEIGGQDSKFIHLRRGLLAEFEMNKICAAGTGSFLEEQADGLGISIFDEFAARAFESESPADLGSKCTVFMESELRRAASEGAPLADLCAGLAYSVARNYLEKVVAGREVGEVVAFQGGTASNAAVVAAFRSLLGRPLRIHPYNRVSGAIGAALIAKREMLRGGYATSFVGFDACESIAPRVFECRSCENLCQVTRFDIRGEKVHFGDVCEKYAGKDASKKSAPRPFEELFSARDRLFEKRVADAGKNRGESRGEIAIPRASVMLELGPLFAGWLRELGFEPTMSFPTNRDVVELGGRGLPGELCLPIKVAVGHSRAMSAADPGRPVFAPSVIEMPEAGNGNGGSSTCFLSQEWPLFASTRSEGRIIAPQFGIAELGDYHEAVRAVSKAFDIPKTTVALALYRALSAQKRFDEDRWQLGREALESNFDRAVVVIGRPYNLHDPYCNTNLARLLDKVGLPAIPVDLLPLDPEDANVSPDTVPWRFARQALAAGAAIARDPRLFPIVVSSYGCGVDGFVLKHLEESLGNRPHLLLEFDEHRAEAGLVTRLEAFFDEIDEHLKGAIATTPRGRIIGGRWSGTLSPRRFFVPHLAEFSHVYAGALRSVGHETVLLPPPTQKTISLGEAHCSGRECHPFSVVTGQLVELIESGEARQGDAIIVPSSVSPCLIKQYGDGQRIVQARMGATYPEIIDIPSSRLGELVGTMGVFRFFEGLTAIDLLLPLARRVRPYAEDPGAPLRRFAEAGVEIENALAEKRDLHPILEAASREIWAMAVRGKPGDRPIVGVTGDLYTRFVDAGNAGLFDRLESLGMEVWPSPFYAACSPMSDTHDRRRDFIRLKAGDALRRSIAIPSTVALYRSLLRTLPPEVVPLVEEPPTTGILDLAAPFTGPASSWLYVLAVGKIVDFLARGADGVISAAGVNCMIGTAIAGVVPSICATAQGAPVITLTYGGVEGPAQRIALETFAHQVATHAAKRRAQNA